MLSLSISVSVSLSAPGEVDCKEIGDCVPGPGATSTDLCLPALDYLRRCSQVRGAATLGLEDADGHSRCILLKPRTVIFCYF